MMIIFILLFILASSSTVQGTTLSDAATALSPGSWSAALTTTNFNNGGIMRPPGGGSAMEFADEAHWNPLNNTAMLLGASHPSGGDNSIRFQAFVKYNDATNTWIEFTLWPDWVGGVGGNQGSAHEYHHAAINPSTGDLYHRQYDSFNIDKFSHANQTWSSCTNWGGGTKQVAGALEYFPDRNSLVYLDGDWGVWELSLASGNCTGSWIQRASTIGGGFNPQLTGLFGYHNQSRYSSRCQCIVMGGGNGVTTLYRFNANGTFTSVAAPPSGVQVIAIPQTNNGTIFTVDPVSGFILVWYYSNAQTTMYTYDPLNNVWATISRASPMFPGPEGTITHTMAIPISTYGVIMFVSSGSTAGGQVRLYKHSVGTPDTTNPTAPTNLIATTLSASQINLNWTDATDNIGVAGYRVERCTPAACSNFAQVYTPQANSQADTGLAASTLYRYRVRAIDGAGNLGPYSNIAEATTSPPLAGDFATRCAAAGVVLCNPFDTDTNRGTVGSTAFGANFGVFNNGVSNCPTTGPSQCPAIDTVVKASGAGALKFVVPTQSGSSGSGQFFTNFSSNLATRFGSGQTFYVQWRQRFTSCFLFQGASEPCTGPPRAFVGGGGWKIADISTGDRAGVCLANGTNCATSCTELELVWTTTSTRGVPQGYNGCPGTYGGLGGGSFIFEEPFGGSDFKLQNAYLISGSPGWCPYSQLVNANNRTNCWSWTANEWLTFKVRVTLGTYQQTGCAGTEQWCYPNSTVEFWGGRDGQPTTKLHSYTYAVNGDDTGTEAEKYGKIWLLPYNTGKSSSEVHPEMYVWYDELIISTQDIADPSASVPPGPSVLKGIVASGKIVTSGKVKSQ